MSRRPLNILLLEDNPAEAELVSSALKRLASKTILYIVNTIDAAKQFISKSPPYDDSPRPDLVLVDIRIGPESGLEFVRWCKSHPRLKRVHLIVFSGSNLVKDKTQTYKLGASAFESKPLTFDELTESLSRIINQWCD